MGNLLQGHRQRPASKIDASRVTDRSSVAAKGIAHYRGLPAFGLLQHAAQTIPTFEAIRYGQQSWSYAKLNHDAIRAAAMLQRIGVRPGDRVGILLPNVPEYVIAANAIWRSGAVAIAISPLMVRDEVSKLLRATNCRYVICLDMLSHLIETENRNLRSLLVSIRQHLPALQQLGYLWERHSRTGCWTLPTTDSCHWFWNEVAATTRNWQPITIDAATDPAYIIPTGGTTGAPKAVTLSHQSMVANAWQQYQWTGGSFGNETMLAVLPFFHSYGMSATVMAGVAMGATLVLHHRFSTQKTIQLIRQHRPTVFHAVPAMLDAMNERLRLQKTPLEGIRWVISGGAPLDAEVAGEFASHTGALVVEGYGLSETSPVTHVGDLFGEASYGTIGFPLPETLCRIVDKDGLAVMPGTAGELLVRGPQVMLGYWNDRTATREAIRNGWLHTGDLAVGQDDGSYRIVGRKKDLIITSGFNVYPVEVEAALREADGVLDAAVVSQPCPHRGELVKAFVVMRPGADWDEQAIRHHCAQTLSKQKRPRVYEQWAGDLPRNFLGKVIRRKLREVESKINDPLNQEAK